MTSIRIGSSAKKTTSKPKKNYSSEDDDYSHEDDRDYSSSTRDEETEEEKPKKKSSIVISSSSSRRDTSEDDEDREAKNNKKNLQNGFDENMNSKKTAPSVAPKPLGPFVPPLVSRAKKEWPPPDERYDAFAVEGMGRVNPYTRELEPLEDPNKIEEEEGEKRTEIVEEHHQPVSQLKKKWQDRPQVRQLGVQRPFVEHKQEKSWIKHIKPPPQYETPPEEPDWKQLVRNRRWQSTVKARFPCKEEDIVEFERRSTTPKNWKKLLLDKKAVRTIGQITGIGPEGEELLWRLAKQRTKTNEEKEEFDIPGEADTLAYEAVKTNLEAAVTEAAIHAGIDLDEIEDEEESGGEESTKTGTRKHSSISSLSPQAIRKKLLRLHPEEFKKLLALDRARDAHLRWQFSTDPYDSVHEHQLLPWELALLSGEKDRRLRFLLRKLLKSDDAPSSVFSSGASTPRQGRADSIPGQYESDSEQSVGSVGSGRPSRKKKPPAVPPRRGRSASPSVKEKTNAYEEDEPEISHGFLSPEEEELAAELRKLEELTEGLGLPPEVQEMLRNSAVSGGLTDMPEDSISKSVEDRLKSFLEDVQRQQGKKPLADDADIDKDEIASRRRRFLDQERQSSTDKDQVPEKSKTRHKVKRIKSDAELFAVMNKRRQAASVDDEDETSSQTTNEIKNLLKDISRTYGEEHSKKDSIDEEEDQSEEHHEDGEGRKRGR